MPSTTATTRMTGTAASRATAVSGRSAPSAQPARIRLTRRGRVAAFAAATLVVVATGLGGVGVASAQAGGPGPSLAVVEHTVSSGETLWRIAQQVTSPGEDVRDTVAELERINGLRGAALMAGQQILVPER